ncbi:hypothetical protein H2201_000192 [Coniosporium apollinis]|uniref:F-box domain-containing protein n=2 Tax=Coniosporium TaxID=2810619 RepID=A0ABQ9P767_9PEZI|nr:hypothetical protein H2199_008166 [Cladosporium sp. JES 115]KAJ9669806.1 hypothetical protein H2201_000192 [Coniosporium apollinis]
MSTNSPKQPVVPNPTGKRKRSLSATGLAKSSTKPTKKTKSSSDTVIASPLLRLPAELRNMIWGYAADWSDINETIAECRGQICTKQAMRDTLSTPTVLLLCRQVTAEALDVLHRKPLILEENLYHICHKNDCCGLRCFIIERTLRNVQTLVINLNDSLDMYEEDWRVLVCPGSGAFASNENVERKTIRLRLQEDCSEDAIEGFISFVCRSVRNTAITDPPKINA